MAEEIIVKKSIADAFAWLMKQGRVLFFSAPCGFGKTAVARTMLADKKALCLSAADTDFSLPEKDGNWKILMVDDLQALGEEDWKRLCLLIREGSDRRFVLLSRGVPDGSLMAFQYAGLMRLLGPKDLLLEREDVRRLLQSYGVTVSESVISGILKQSIGFPLGVVITARILAQGRPFTPELVGEAFQEVFFYFETAVYKPFDLPIRRFLLELAPFESFDLEMARMVTGDPHAGEQLDWLQRKTTMLRYDGVEHFHFWEQFRMFLLWEMNRECSPEKRRALLTRGGMYYELKEDYAHALDCYTRGGDHSKVSELLIRNAELHPGMGHYQQMEKYYRSLPESEILASPSLMQGMSMLCALGGDFEGSEKWYDALGRFAQSCEKGDAAGRQARSRMAWLDISLPQRDVEKLTETIPAVFRLMTNKEIVMPPFSVTSTLPSLMNGGKDFSVWSKKDDLLYATIRHPVEAVLGKDGVGLPDCALAESKFEKGEDISGRMLSLVQQIGQVQHRGTPDLEFAITGLLARSQMASGKAGEARRTIGNLRERFEETGQARFLPNIDAMLCRIDLRTGDLDAAESWYRDKAPKDPLHFDAMKRYQYLTQAMAELALGQPEDTLMTLAPMENYCAVCRRRLDGLTANLLRAAAMYRCKEELWRETLKAALVEAEEYRFTRPISAYGAAVLPLLEQTKWEGDARWWKKLLADTRSQASFYPGFLQPRSASAETLTATEMKVLRLICADKSNAEIGEIMHIKLPTVKTHVSRVLDKLGVSRRSEAKTAAKRLWLVPEDL